MKEKTSRISRFHKLSFQERVAALEAAGWLSKNSGDSLRSDVTGGLLQDKAEYWSENNLGTFALPWGACLNLQVDGRDVIVPMAVEEPSVVAAVSYAARQTRELGGFKTESTDSLMAAQIQYVNVPDVADFRQKIAANQEEIFRRAAEILPGLARRGGGLRAIEVRDLPALPEEGDTGPDMTVVHLVADVKDAMGANLLNTLAEAISPYISELAGVQHILRILTNLCDQRITRASCEIPVVGLRLDNEDGEMLAERIELASLFAERDPYRATTHNKGIFNGIDAVAIASGNDWRQIEAACHAYAARNGRYTALSKWRYDRERQLVRGEIEVPLAMGTVGAQIQGHGRTRLFYEMTGVTKSDELARIVAAVGLAQNFAAIRALSDEGIQSGHMRLHARNVALSAGCPPERIEEVVDELIKRENIKIDEAERILKGE